MRRRALIGALLLVGVGVALGATVFRTDIAQATGLAQAVTVSNTAAQAVPVREQNLDNGNIKVHEEGTASVNVTNSSLSVHEQGTASVKPGGEPIIVQLFGDGQYTVPAGKQFNLQYVSGVVFGGSGPNVWSLCTSPCSANLAGNLANFVATQINGSPFLAVNELVSITFAPGTTLYVHPGTGGTPGINLSGYLTSTP